MSDRPKDGFLVEGTIEHPQAGKHIALYKVTPQEQVLVDSIAADGSGKFRFIGKVDQLQMFMLSVYGQKEFFVAGNEDVQIEVKGDSPAATIQVKAGEEEAKLVPVLTTFRRQSEEFQPMYYEYGLALQNRDMDRAERYRGMIERGSTFFKARYKHLIDSLGPSFGSYTAATRLDLSEDFGTLDTLSQKLQAKYRGQAWAEEFAKQISEARALATGQQAPLFKQATPAGAMVGPESFRGKYLVLDFWASWCKPCRMNSPAMVALYKKYREKGVEILGVSLDKDKDRWTAAIADDGYTWPQVSDLQEWSNEAARLYKVEGIPHLVLLDKEGKMIARELTPDKLDRLLAGLTSASM